MLFPVTALGPLTGYSEIEIGLRIEALVLKIARLLRYIDLAMRIFQKLQAVIFAFFAAVWQK